MVPRSPRFCAILSPCTVYRYRLPDISVTYVRTSLVRRIHVPFFSYKKSTHGYTAEQGYTLRNMRLIPHHPSHMTLQWHHGVGFHSNSNIQVVSYMFRRNVRFYGYKLRKKNVLGDEWMWKALHEGGVGSGRELGRSQLNFDGFKIYFLDQSWFSLSFPFPRDY